MNIHTGVTAFQAGQADFHGNIALRNISIFLKLHGDIQIGTTGTTDKQLAFFLRITVQQDFPFQETRLQTDCAIHSHFFVNGKKGFQRTVGQCLVRQDSHSKSSTHTVISTQCRFACFHPISIYISIDRIG